jgi:PAS domain S-box-containing protein
MAKKTSKKRKKTAKKRSPSFRVRVMRSLMGTDAQADYLVQLARGYELVSDTVTISEPTGNRLVYVNQAWLELYGYAPGEVLGQSADVMNLKGVSAALLATIASSTSRGGWEGELLNQDRIGNVFSVRLRTVPLEGPSGEVLGLLGVCVPRKCNVKAKGQKKVIQFKMPSANGSGEPSRVLPGGDWKTTLSALTPKELEVLARLGQGFNTHQIGHALGMSVYTVQTHRNHLKKKLGMRTISELNYMAYQWANSGAKKRG